MSEKEKSSRRKFLSLSLLGSAGLITGKAAANTPPESGEKVKMLTPDGQLVEVDKSVLEQSANRQKVNNKDILDWVAPAGKP